MKIFLIGFMGCGKSHWGKLLADHLKIPFIDLDEQITNDQQKSIPQIFADSGEEAFRMIEKETLEKMIDEHETMVLSVGGGTPCFFNNIVAMKKKGTVVWLNTQVDILVDRLVKAKNERPLIREINDDNLRSYIIKKLNERKMYYEQADLVIDNESSITPANLIQTILHA
ncbi:MAG: shikimate kinase [Flavitalea sp.]